MMTTFKVQVIVTWYKEMMEDMIFYSSQGFINDSSLRQLGLGL